MTRKQKLVVLMDVLVVLFISLPGAGLAAGSLSQTVALIGLILIALATIALQFWVVSYCRTHQRPSWPTSPKPTSPPPGY